MVTCQGANCLLPTASRQLFLIALTRLRRRLKVEGRKTKVKAERRAEVPEQKQALLKDEK